MSKGLEALQTLEDCYLDGDGGYRLTSIIRQELKELEILRNLKLLPYPKKGNDKEYRQGVVKRLMALEVVKKYIKVEKDEYGLYWLCGAFGSVGITQEEYELLKEVLQ